MSDEPRAPLGERNGEIAASTVKFSDAPAAVIPARAPAAPRGLNVVPSFSVMSSGLASAVSAEELIMKGARKKPVGAMSLDQFYRSITHLHFANQKLLGDVAAVSLCANLRVLYVYENRLTTLRGLGGLQRLTHLYAQENHIESLHDFEAPPNLEQLHLTGNRLTTIGGLETCTCLIELHIGGQKRAPSPDSPSADAAPAGHTDLLILDNPDDPDSPTSADGERAASKAAIAQAAVAAADAEAAAAAPPVMIEPASLLAIAPTLQKLVLTHGPCPL